MSHPQFKTSLTTPCQMLKAAGGDKEVWDRSYPLSPSLLCPHVGVMRDLSLQQSAPPADLSLQSGLPESEAGHRSGSQCRPADP